MEEFAGGCIVIFLLVWLVAGLVEWLAAFVVSHRFQLLAIAVVTVVGGVVWTLAKAAIIREKKRRENEERWKEAREQAAKQEEGRRKYEEERRKAEQNLLHTTLVNIVSDSKKTALELPALVRKAELSLDHAEEEFSGRYFAPFWNAIEDAAVALTTFDEHIESLSEMALEYRSKATHLTGPSPPFELGIRVLPNATRTIERMSTIVRQAQKDRDFAFIYEQRRTNDLLVAGFSTLGQVLGGLQSSLEWSLEKLRSSVSAAIAGAATTQNDAAFIIVAELKETMERESEARREDERIKQGMLDNIQRGEKPAQ